MSSIEATNNPAVNNSAVEQSFFKSTKARVLPAIVNAQKSLADVGFSDSRRDGYNSLIRSSVSEMQSYIADHDFNDGIALINSTIAKSQESEEKVRSFINIGGGNFLEKNKLILNGDEANHISGLLPLTKENGIYKQLYKKAIEEFANDEENFGAEVAGKNFSEKLSQLARFTPIDDVFPAPDSILGAVTYAVSKEKISAALEFVKALEANGATIPVINWAELSENTLQAQFNRIGAKANAVKEFMQIDEQLNSVKEIQKQNQEALSQARKELKDLQNEFKKNPLAEVVIPHRKVFTLDKTPELCEEHIAQAQETISKAQPVIEQQRVRDARIAEMNSKIASLEETTNISKSVVEGFKDKKKEFVKNFEDIDFSISSEMLQSFEDAQAKITAQIAEIRRPYEEAAAAKAAQEAQEEAAAKAAQEAQEAAAAAKQAQHEKNVQLMKNIGFGVATIAVIAGLAYAGYKNREAIRAGINNGAAYVKPKLMKAREVASEKASNTKKVISEKVAPVYKNVAEKAAQGRKSMTEKAASGREMISEKARVGYNTVTTQVGSLTSAVSNSRAATKIGNGYTTIANSTVVTTIGNTGRKMSAKAAEIKDSVATSRVGTKVTETVGPVVDKIAAKFSKLPVAVPVAVPVSAGTFLGNMRIVDGKAVG